MGQAKNRAAEINELKKTPRITGQVLKVEGIDLFFTKDHPRLKDLIQDLCAVIAKQLQIREDITISVGQATSPVYTDQEFQVTLMWETPVDAPAVMMLGALRIMFDELPELGYQGAEFYVCASAENVRELFAA